MPAYRLSSPYDRPPLRRRLSGFALALGVNLGLVLVLLTLGIVPAPERKPSNATIVDLMPESHDSQRQAERKAPARQPLAETRPLPKPPPIVLPVKPTIAPSPTADKPLQMIEMTKEEYAASDVGKLPKAGTGSAGDSNVVGRGPHGELLYAAEWAREPTDAELGGYLPRNAPEGFGLIACKTIPGNRVEDCVELDQWPHGSRLASAVRQAAWQFRVRPPRKDGKLLVGQWVRIRIDYLGSRTAE